MATDNQTTITVKFPLPVGAADQFAVFAERLGFLDDWDGERVELSLLGPGVQKFFVAAITLDDMRAVVALAKANSFSIVVHADWTGDYESDVPGNIYAFDAADRRSIDTWSTCHSGEPVVSLKDALRLTRAEIRAKFSLPAELC